MVGKDIAIIGSEFFPSSFSFRFFVAFFFKFTCPFLSKRYCFVFKSGACRSLQCLGWELNWCLREGGWAGWRPDEKVSEGS